MKIPKNQHFCIPFPSPSRVMSFINDIPYESECDAEFNRFKNGSLFTYLTATVTVNGLENEMSSELRFQGRKWGVTSRVHLLKTPNF